MLNIGLPEMVVIAGIALIFLGPEKFPSQAKIFLRMLRDVRDHWDEAKREITKELNPVKSELRDLQRFRPEELLDKMTGDAPKSSSSTQSPSEDPYGQGYPYASVIEDAAKKTDENTVEFGTSTAEIPPQGRSEDSAWERKDEPGNGALTEEDEHRAAMKDADPRPKDGSD
ncbi:MAG TPA: hypothetical protein PLJ47_14565 [Candidatus Hydrogenedentes bacterium]|nr:hypothetical protein [Candidatus Hydrogenedentota bacterium]HRK35817.1 hypothetical protein [Candidatus Hydrogenedentota bacterium]